VTTTTTELTVPEKILLAAHDLEDQGQSPFSAEALIVAAWKRFPKTFGLKGYSDQFPDSNKILTSIMGEKGLARRGWLSKMGQKLYSLTREGRLMVRQMEPGAKPAQATAALSTKLSRDQEKFLLNQFNSTAAQKFQEGLKPELTFGDACKFWGINESTHGTVLDARLDRLRANLAEIDRVLSAGDVVMSTGRNVSLTDVNLLHEVDEYLVERFGRHLTLLRNRGGRG
jgi:hypothetical protein